MTAKPARRREPKPGLEIPDTFEEVIEALVKPAPSKPTQRLDGAQQ